MIHSGVAVGTRPSACEGFRAWCSTSRPRRGRAGSRRTEPGVNWFLRIHAAGGRQRGAGRRRPVLALSRPEVGVRVPSGAQQQQWCHVQSGHGRQLLAGAPPGDGGVAQVAAGMEVRRWPRPTFQDPSKTLKVPRCDRGEAFAVDGGVRDEGGEELGPACRCTVCRGDARAATLDDLEEQSRVLLIALTQAGPAR